MNVNMRLPAIVVNFKVYEQGTGDNALRLALIHQKVAEETGVSIAIAVSALDLEKVAKAVNIPVFAQHVDPGAALGGEPGTDGVGTALASA